MTGPEYHGWTHMPKAQGGTDPIPGLGEGLPLLRFAKCTGADFTATDGAYYGLAQLVGADPSLYGVAGQITLYNDPGDGTGTWYVDTSGASAPGCLQLYGNNFLMGYDIGVEFDSTFTTGTATLWIGYGVGGGDAYAYEVAQIPDPSVFTGNPVLRLTGHLPVTAPSHTGSGQKIGGVLLCEGADADVLTTWCYLSVLSDLESGAVTTYTP